MAERHEHDRGAEHHDPREGGVAQGRVRRGRGRIRRPMLDGGQHDDDEHRDDDHERGNDRERHPPAHRRTQEGTQRQSRDTRDRGASRRDCHGACEPLRGDEARGIRSDDSPEHTVGSAPDDASDQQHGIARRERRDEIGDGKHCEQGDKQ